MSKLIFDVQRCRMCRCVEAHACEGGCSWVEADLCSVCAPVVLALEEYFDRSMMPTKAAVLREVNRAIALSEPTP